MDFCSELKSFLAQLGKVSPYLFFSCLMQGAVGFKGTKRGTNFAGQEAGEEAARVS